MIAMILAAGFGTRLKKLTKNLPKPLINIDINDKIIDSVITNLIDFKINDILINLHYKSEIISKYLKKRYPQINWIFSYEKEILNTGGGIFNNSKFLSNYEDILIVNSDILFRANLSKMYKIHKKEDNIATILTFGENKNRAVVYDSENKLLAYTLKNGDFYPKDVKIPKKHFYSTFTGIYFLKTEIFKKFIPSQKKFSITSVFLKFQPRILKMKNLIWQDLGTLEDLSSGKILYKKIKFIEKNLNCKCIKYNKKEFPFSTKDIFKIEFRENSEKKSIIYSKIDSETKHISEKLNQNDFRNPKILFENHSIRIQEYIPGKTLLDMNFSLEIYKKILLKIISLKKISLEKLNLNKEFDLDNIIFDLKYYGKQIENVKDFAKFIFSFFKNEKKSLIHRDLQSTNVIISKKNEIYFIDLETFRIGYNTYDAASFILDTYQNLDKNTIDELVNFYLEKSGSKRITFWISALIRLLHDYGTFYRNPKSFKKYQSKIKINFVLNKIKNLSPDSYSIIKKFLK